MVPSRLWGLVLPSSLRKTSASHRARIRNNVLFLIGMFVFAMGGCHGGCCKCHCFDCDVDDDDDEEEEEETREQSNASTGCYSAPESDGCSTPYADDTGATYYDPDLTPDVGTTPDSQSLADAGSDLDRCRESLEILYSTSQPDLVRFVSDDYHVHVVELGALPTVTWRRLRNDGQRLREFEPVRLTRGLETPTAWAVIDRENGERVLLAAQDEGVQGVIANLRSPNSVHMFDGGIEYQTSGEVDPADLPTYDVLLDAFDAGGSMWAFVRTHSGVVEIVDDVVTEDVRAQLHLIRFDPLGRPGESEVFEIDDAALAADALAIAAHAMEDEMHLFVTTAEGLYVRSLTPDGPDDEGWQSLFETPLAHLSTITNPTAIYIMVAEPREDVNSTRRAVYLFRFHPRVEEFTLLREWSLHGLFASLSPMSLQRDGSDLLVSYVSASDEILRADRVGTSSGLTRESLLEVESLGEMVVIPLPEAGESAFVSHVEGSIRIGDCFGGQ